MYLKFCFCLFLLISFTFKAIGQLNTDSARKIVRDSSEILHADTLIRRSEKIVAYPQLLKQILARNRHLDLNAKAQYLVSAERDKSGKEFQFYFILALLLFLAFYKTAYGKYFNNIFRVFFNTSLRQNQLTDILRQSKLPSLILNIFFTIIAGFYLWLVFDHYNVINNTDNKNILLLTILLVAIMFSLKFIVLKFTGWVTGMSTSTDVYIFIIFLINKMIGLFLIPVVVLLTFSNPQYVQGITVFSFLIIGFLFLLQLFRSYGLLQTQLKMNGLHFLFYIIGFEILPYVLIFKWAATTFLATV